MLRIWRERRAAQGLEARAIMAALAKVSPPPPLPANQWPPTPAEPPPRTRPPSPPRPPTTNAPSSAPGTLKCEALYCIVRTALVQLPQ